MDSHDIFRQLTFSVNFKSYKNNFITIAKPHEFNETTQKNFNCHDIEIKTEDTTDSEHSCDIEHATGFDFSDTEIKEEIKSEDEGGDDGGNLFSNLCNMPMRKKKSKVITEETVNQLKIEEINHSRNVYNIHVSGKKPPPPIESFEQLQEKYRLSKKLMDNIKQCGYSTPTPIQMQAIPALLLGRPIAACAPTGSGKTAAFLIPIIRDLKGPENKGFRALIVCPTRELAKQTQRECLRIAENFEFRVHIISKVNQAAMKYGLNSSKKYDILITTPNRICYLLNQEPPQLDLSNVQWLVLDEADKLFETGVNSFREQFNQIYKACTLANKKIAMFSATHTPHVAKWCNQNYKNILSITIGHKNAATELVNQELLFVGSESGKLLAFRELVRKGLQPPVLVFVQSKDRAQQLFNELLYDSINVDVIHADRTQQQRDNAVKAFREGKIWILICTELMSRGIDFKGVNLVVNYDFPPSKISYIHRIGRSGRAGRKGRAITFFTQNDAPNLRAIAYIMKDSGCEVPEYMLAMKKLTKRTRRKMEKKAPLRDPIATQPEYITKFRKEHKIDATKDPKMKFKRNKPDKSGDEGESSKKRFKNGKTSEI